MIIAHLFNGKRNVLYFLLLEGGKITGSGTHKELLENHERYARFVGANDRVKVSFEIHHFIVY